MQAQAVAQPNIALIKYWGKRDAHRNLPAVSSLSITLESLRTTMSVEFSETIDADSLSLNDEPAPGLLPRVSACLDRVAGDNRHRARVVSECNFPIAAGLASSASSFAALVVAADAAAGGSSDRLTMARAAGHASGSAARSLYGGFVELDAGTGSEDIRLKPLAEPEEWPLEVIVAVTERGKKAVSSGDAMQRSAETSPFYSRWIEHQSADLNTARAAVQQRDFETLAEIAEHNCLKMHSVTWTSRPPIVYWNTATLSCMQAVRELRQSGAGVFFTIDAGPQVKAVCLPDSANQVAEALAAIPGVVQLMRSGLGNGARLASLGQD